MDRLTRIFGLGVIACTGMMASSALAQSEKAAAPKPAESKAAQPKDDAKQQPMDPMMKAWIDANSPTKDHEVLKKMAGQWECEIKSTMAPGAPTSESKGMMISRVEMEGRYLYGSYRGDMHGMKFTGLALWGFNNGSKKYECTWIDSVSTGQFRTEGTLDAAGKVLTLTGTYVDPMSGKSKNVRQVYEFTEDGKYTSKFYETGPDGKEFLGMEMSCVRRSGEVRPGSAAPSARPTDLKSVEPKKIEPKKEEPKKDAPKQDAPKQG
jgi:hypothetical protein